MLQKHVVYTIYTAAIGIIVIPQTRNQDNVTLHYTYVMIYYRWYAIDNVRLANDIYNVHFVERHLKQHNYNTDKQLYNCICHLMNIITVRYYTVFRKKTPTHIFFHISMNYLWI